MLLLIFSTYMVTLISEFLLYFAFWTKNRKVVWVFIDYHGQLLVIESKAVAKVSLRKQSSYICASHQSHQFSWSLCNSAAVTVFRAAVPMYDISFSGC